MQVFGNKINTSLYTGRSTNAGMFDTNSTNDEVASTIKNSTTQNKGDTFTIRDVDDNANLIVSVRPGVYGPAELRVTNSDDRNSANGAEHVVVAKFPLPNMGEEDAYKLQKQDLTGKEGVDTVTVRELPNGGYEVEIGEFGPGKIHHGFTIRDSANLSRPRGL